MVFVGREKQLKELRERRGTNRNEFIAVYGRRRIGKTLLVETAYQGDFFFRHVGISPEWIKKRKLPPLKTQLKAFEASLALAGWQSKNTLKSWLNAFSELGRFLKSGGEGVRKIIFIDEIPWMDTKKSGFLAAFEWFANMTLTSNLNFVLVVAGSSTSWMMDHITDTHGGLYDRVTMKVRLLPFNLCETEALLRENGAVWPRQLTTMYYMALGGIPYYLNYVRGDASFANNIDALFFKADAKLDDEFVTLFSSMFDRAALCEKIVRTLFLSQRGLTRAEILTEAKTSDGEDFSNALRGLEKGSFVLKYFPYKGDLRTPYYKLIDPFCLFYLANVEHRTNLDSRIFEDDLPVQEISAWKGQAFENVVFLHLSQIKRALGISGVKTMQCSWAPKDRKSGGTQIDLVIERKDGAINLCEMKFYNKKFTIDYAYHETLQRRLKIFRQEAGETREIYQTLITTHGLSQGGYADDFKDVIVLDELFLPEHNA